jgi:hypothetical protein
MQHHPFALSLSKGWTNNIFEAETRSWFDKLTTNGVTFASEKGYRKKLTALVSNPRDSASDPTDPTYPSDRSD